MTPGRLLMVSVPLLVGWLAAAGEPPAAEDATVIGRVSDYETDRPLLGTTVALWSDGAEVVSPVPLNDNGFFTLQPPGSGSYRLAITAEGYEGVLLDTVRVGDDETVEIMVKVTPSRTLQPRWWNVARFKDGECEDWEPYEEIIARRTGRPVFEWRWRLCNESLEEYEVQMQVASKLSERLELTYRLSTDPGYCQSTQPRTALGDRLRGTLRLRATQRSRHRGRRGVIPKIGFGYRVFFCGSWTFENRE